jgi:hypothetical protein
VDNDIIGDEDNGGIGNEDNNQDVLNEYLLEEMRLEDASGDDTDKVSVGAGSGGGGGGVYEVVAVANEDVDVAVDVMDKAVGPPAA